MFYCIKYFIFLPSPIFGKKQRLDLDSTHVTQPPEIYSDDSSQPPEIESDDSKQPPTGPRVISENTDSVNSEIIWIYLL